MVSDIVELRASVRGLHNEWRSLKKNDSGNLPREASEEAKSSVELVLLDEIRVTDEYLQVLSNLNTALKSELKVVKNYEGR